MVAGKRDYEWDHTSLVVATLINANKGKGKPVSPNDIHPTRSSGGGGRGAGGGACAGAGGGGGDDNGVRPIRRFRYHPPIK